jgi:hypothetical protein
LAYIKRIAIKSNLKNSINYISKERNSLNNRIIYIQNENKVSNISGYNVSANAELAYKQMMALKDRFNKKGGVLGHHYIQSFKPGETTPEQAHQIASEFVERAFPNCMVIYATHIDRHHIHNHFTVNSIKLDGTKFRSQTKTLYEARDISNELSLKYSLSIIPKKEFDPTVLERKYDVIRNDINNCILKSDNYEKFKNNLIKIGYGVVDNKHLSLKPRGYKKSTRSKELGEVYTKEFIINRIKDKNFNQEISDKHKLNEKADYLNIMSQFVYKTKAQKDKELWSVSKKIDFINRYNALNIDYELSKLQEKISNINDILSNYEKQKRVVEKLVNDIKYIQLNPHRNQKYNSILANLKKNGIDLKDINYVLGGLEGKLFEIGMKMEEASSKRGFLKSDMAVAREVKNDIELER